MAPRQLHDYWITISVDIQALDDEQASEIARDILSRIKEGGQWKTETAEIISVEKAT